jgi:bifunctional non-homologous end joining protein LigD
VLVRTRRAGRKAQWLLIKHRDRWADPSADPVEAYDTSVVTGRSMEEIAAGAKAKRRTRRA